LIYLVTYSNKLCLIVRSKIRLIEGIQKAEKRENVKQEARRKMRNGKEKTKFLPVRD